MCRAAQARSSGGDYPLVLVSPSRPSSRPYLHFSLTQLSSVHYPVRTCCASMSPARPHSQNVAGRRCLVSCRVPVEAR
ncbi:hypothetical protein PAXINDRAFT_169938 [Paxillus involutus ATCC 200175]|uniref:Uncharacterized protein n=1 Tax=Paxillus involutus ATCC 200175 TaxID=664439 RepID=A0A0C9U4G5_PAXIN|nr:hypothetical protein PAXINDRAFT_169938 [Paxillus involutus ATCC 200175]